MASSILSGASLSSAQRRISDREHGKMMSSRYAPSFAVVLELAYVTMAGSSFSDCKIGGIFRCILRQDTHGTALL